MYNFAALVLLCFTLLPSSLSAQTRFCIGGDLDHLSVAQRNTCVAKMNQIRMLAAKYKAPADWHFVVVCTDTDWGEYAAFSRRSPVQLKEVLADTDLDRKTTFFRGDSLVGGRDGNLERRVTYELASVTLRTTNPGAIEQLMARWDSDLGQDTPELRASHPATASDQTGS